MTNEEWSKAVEFAKHPVSRNTAPSPSPASDALRTFDSGATRHVDTDKFDPEGFFSPLVLDAYQAYMHTHRYQADGTVRDSDNWQKGIPIPVYRKSLIRHTMTAWMIWRGYPVKAENVGGKMVVPTLQDALMGVLFNTMGMLHELLKREQEEEPLEPPQRSIAIGTNEDNMTLRPVKKWAWETEGNK